MTLQELKDMVLLTKVDIVVGDLTLTIQRVPKGWIFIYRKTLGITQALGSIFVEEPISLRVGHYEGPDIHG